MTKKINADAEFIGYTLGLECWVKRQLTLVRVEYSRNTDGTVTLQAVSGRNLESYGPRWSTTITHQAFAARPDDPCNNVQEARWALTQLGLRPARDEARERAEYDTWQR